VGGWTGREAGLGFGVWVGVGVREQFGDRLGWVGDWLANSPPNQEGKYHCIHRYRLVAH
jgi:hypothetical protein